MKQNQNTEAAQVALDNVGFCNEPPASNFCSIESSCQLQAHKASNYKVYCTNAKTQAACTKSPASSYCQWSGTDSTFASMMALGKSNNNPVPANGALYTITNAYRI